MIFCSMEINNIILSHQKLAPLPMDRQLPDGDWLVIGQVNSCNVSPKVGFYPEANVQP